MAERARHPLTPPLSFRRDVRLFLGVLTGFLVVVVLVLLVMMRNFFVDTEDAIQSQWRVIAAASAAQLSAATTDRDADARAVEILDRGDVAGIRENVSPSRSWGVAGGSGFETITLPRGRNGSYTFLFDAAPLNTARQTLLLTSVIAVGGSAAAVILLLLYLPRITRPIDELMAHAKRIADRDAAQEDTDYLIQTFRDTIDRLKSRADELELVSATLTRSLTSGFISIDTEGRVVQMNGAAREILAIEPEAPVAGKTVGELLGDTTLAHVLAPETRSKVIARQEIEHATPRGEITLGVTAVPLIDAAGETLGTLALFTDLTPVKDLEARVRTMQTLADLGEISAGIAHEFRNSLSTIVGYLRLARRSALPEEADARVKAANDEATLLSAAVERLLAFARPMRLQIDDVDLATVVTPIVERLSDAAPQVAFTMEGDAPTIEGDRALIARAVENVLRNAVDAVEESPTKTIRVRFEPRAIKVIDSGIGLDPTTAARLLLPFQSDKPKGFGLGLSLTRKIMILHGGDVELHGAPGAGAEVTLKFGDMTDAKGNSFAQPEIALPSPQSR
ncbi:MAG TPA: ATP-binding protein [Thermoanaerobaculia bacterium]|nr:ATP-binding protein [Thermoanaerobaculia bacterium]